jgi:hypothetical protein
MDAKGFPVVEAGWRARKIQDPRQKVENPLARGIGWSRRGREQ